MKFIILVVLAVVGVQITSAGVDEEQIDRVLWQCRAQNGIDVETEIDIQAENMCEEHLCFLKCILTQHGISDEEGNINPRGLEAVYDITVTKEKEQQLLKCANDRKNKYRNSPCSVVHRVIECIDDSYPNISV